MSPGNHCWDHYCGTISSLVNYCKLTPTTTTPSSSSSSSSSSSPPPPHNSIFKPIPRCIIEGILPKGPYLPCVSMAGRALLAEYPRYFRCSVDLALWHDFPFASCTSDLLIHLPRRFFIKWSENVICKMVPFCFRPRVYGILVVVVTNITIVLHITKLLHHQVIQVYFKHYSDVIMSTIASQITGVSIVCSSVCSGVDQRKHQSSASLAFVRGSFNAGAINAENVSIWWRHHEIFLMYVLMSERILIKCC